jgi:hypothetical protein
LAADNDRNEQPMATADGDVETKAYFRKYSIAIKLYLSLAAQQTTPVAIYPEGYSCSRAALLSFNRINDNLTSSIILISMMILMISMMKNRHRQLAFDQGTNVDVDVDVDDI